MAEANTEGSGKSKAEVTMVKMEDGREVGFAGKRKVLKDTVLDETKIIKDGDTVTLSDGAVSIRMDFRNGKTLLLPIKAAMVPLFAGHGGEQKYGDELAASKSDPLSPEDMVLAVEDLHKQLYDEMEWSAAREGGGGFAGASVVVQAICEGTRKDPNDPASGKSVDEVKAFLQGKLDAAKAKGEKLSRKDLYDSFRNPNTKIGKIIKRIEEERLAKASAVDADAALAELG